MFLSKLWKHNCHLHNTRRYCLLMFHMDSSKILKRHCMVHMYPPIENHNRSKEGKYETRLIWSSKYIYEEVGYMWQLPQNNLHHTLPGINETYIYKLLKGNKKRIDFMVKVLIREVGRLWKCLQGDMPSNRVSFITHWTRRFISPYVRYFFSFLVSLPHF